MTTTTTTTVSTTPDPASGGPPPVALRPLWLTETYPPNRGGMAQSCDRIVRSLRRRGVTVDVVHFTPRPNGRPFRIERQAGGRYVSCPVDDDPAHALNRSWIAIADDPATAGVTHVVAFGGLRPMLAGPVYAAWLGVPLVTLVRGNDFDVAVFSARRRPLLDDALGRSALVCAVSEDKAHKIRALHPAVPVRRIPNGIDLDEWRPAPSDASRASAWREANTLAGARVVGLFGQLKTKKGGRLLLDAWRRLSRPEALHLVLAGTLDAELETWLREGSGAQLPVTVLPFLDRFELMPWFAACDWVAIPSYYDGLPNVLVEAAALGVPLLATRVAGMADVLTDGETAVLFEAGDEAGCARALELVASIPEPVRVAMGAACRRLAERELNAMLEADRYIAALTDSATTPAGALAPLSKYR
jgi:glycosyltransferase involved in cell wall biosynthesis